jgi:glycosyltransferase involved in cell wall biosynthesis
MLDAVIPGIHTVLWRKQMKLIIQIPCFNEEEVLPQAIADLPKQIDGIDEIEYLVINDGSTDNTVAVAHQLGVHHIVSFKQNKGLAKGFMAGIDACLHLGADIIVNTDADNQYVGEDIGKLIAPILAGKADIVIGERQIDEIEHFSASKKFFQHLGSFVVRLVSDTKISDAPSGFRAYSREAALRLNVTNDYTYTLETIIQAGHSRAAVVSVPIRTNPETRPSRLFSSMWKYMKRSASIISRSFIMYKPLKFFGILGSVLFLIGTAISVRFLILFLNGMGSGHVQSLILAAILLLMGFMAFMFGLVGDVISANRKLLEDIQYRVRKMEIECTDEET